MKTIAKRLILFLGFAAAAGFFTYSYFSDTETSTGNAFAAGKLDLIVNVDNQPLTNSIFNLPDMKPGDPGEKTVKIKVDDNPACGTVAVNLTSDLDNSCTEPEGKAEMKGAGNTEGCDTAGELNDTLNFGIFSDANCNNVYETGDLFLTQGTLTGNVTYHIGELGTAEKCYGVQWCFGTMTVDETAHTIACDGSLLGNISQTDSFTAELVVTALQKRNQFDAGCPVDGAVSPTCTPTNGGTEICGNQIDEDCNGSDLVCQAQCIPVTEICGDGIDQDCNGSDLICTPQCTSDTQCNDNKACTADVCVNGSCVRTPNNNICPNNNSCLLATCVGAIAGADSWGCAYQASANIGSSCWSTGCLGNCNGWTCNSSGGCVAPGQTPPSGCTSSDQCSDGDSCTSDTCSAGTCYHLNLVAGQCIFGGSCSNGNVTCNPNPNCAGGCDDNNPCTIDSCQITGCTHTSKDCNDNNAGTYDTCNPTTGVCTSFALPTIDLGFCINFTWGGQWCNGS